jgi:hypothetical protein
MCILEEMKKKIKKKYGKRNKNLMKNINFHFECEFFRRSLIYANIRHIKKIITLLLIKKICEKV